MSVPSTAGVTTATASGTHSCVLAPHLKDDLSRGSQGKYGRMFADLPCNECDEVIFAALGRSGALMDVARAADARASDETPGCIPAGYPIFGQLIAHNITADRSLLQHHANLGEIRNFRTPSLNLESFYSAGPSGSPYLYDVNDPAKFLLGINDAGQPNDLPRNAQGVALIGDPRDDVHLLISQLHMVFLNFHNAIVDHLRADGVAAADTFGEAQRLTRWHYQWIVVHEFLPLLVGDAVLNDVLDGGRRYYLPEGRSYIPVEFSDAAYRAGHSQIRSEYQVNDQARGQVFPDFAGGHSVPQAQVIDWRYFFDLDAGHPQRPLSLRHMAAGSLTPGSLSLTAYDPGSLPQPSKRIEARLAHTLIDLPPRVVGTVTSPEEASLAYRDLQRARSLDLPSGEAVARLMGIEPLTAEEVGLQALGWYGDTPLWYYVLREGDIRTGGVRLGEMGGRIVAEVLIGLLDADPTSYRGAMPDWQPTLPSAQPGAFTMADLLRFAGAA
jgi:Animal haem peroxidase